MEHSRLIALFPTSLRPTGLKNRRGFSVINAMIFVAITAVISLALSTLISDSYRHQSQMKRSLEVRELNEEVLELVKTPNCGIRDFSAGPIPVKDRTWKPETSFPLKHGLLGRFIEVKSGDKYGNLKVSEIRLGPYYDRFKKTSRYVALDTPDPDNFSNARSVRASLQLDIADQNRETHFVRVPVNLVLNPEGSEITGCNPESSAATIAELCFSLGGNWNESESRCELPCPPGMITGAGGACRLSTGENTYCKVNEKCDVDSKYVL